MSSWQRIPQTSSIGSHSPDNLLTLQDGGHADFAFAGTPYFIESYYHEGRRHLFKGNELPPGARVEHRALVNVFDLLALTVLVADLSAFVFEHARFLLLSHAQSDNAFRMSRLRNHEGKIRFHLDHLRKLLPIERQAILGAKIHDLAEFAASMYGRPQPVGQRETPVASDVAAISPSDAESIRGLLADRVPMAMSDLLAAYGVPALSGLPADQADSAKHWALAASERYAPLITPTPPRDDDKNNL